MKTMKLKTLTAALLSLGLIASVPVFAEDSALPEEAQAQSEASESVQPQVDAKAADRAAETRSLTSAASTARSTTRI